MIFTKPLVISCVLATILASISWMGALSKFDLSYAFPFISLNFVIVISLSMVFFNEPFNWPKIIGTFFICTGIFITSKGI